MRLQSIMIVLATISITATGTAQSVKWIPERSVATSSYARGIHISPNGRFAVGAYFLNGEHHIFVYDRCQSTVTTVSRGAAHRYPWYISGDGQIIGGLHFGASIWNRTSNGFEHIRLAESGEILGLSLVGDHLVGYTGDPNATGIPSVWQRNGSQWERIILPMSDTLPHGIAFVCSAEGDTIVGHSYRSGSDIWSNLYPTVWRRNDQSYSVEILDRPSGFNFVEMFATSLDGTVLGGQLNNQYGYVWVNGNYTIIPPLLGGVRSDVGDGFQTNGISPDGNVVVGWSCCHQGNTRAIRWTRQNGTEDLMTLYNLDPDQEFLERAAAASLGGRYIVGHGWTFDNGNWYRRAYILDTCELQADIDGNCCVDDADLLIVLFEFGSTSLLSYADINCDGIVDDADLLIVLFEFGNGCQN